VEVFRIGSSAHPLLDGAGAAASDTARWNSRGRFVIYAAEHYATAVLERAAQAGSIRLPRTLVFVRIVLPADAVLEEVRPDDVPGWDADDRAASRAFGDRWYDDRRSLVLLVPALAAPGLERNVVINQRHPQFAAVTASRPEPLVVHPRLVSV
jgi:RES domain-containing protein